ncbi:MAG TPA: V-type ATP synthase subunit E [Firmicutes bacterium]|nr:V-type ATP synthase subunit E [Bacillota bacterium]
MANSEEKISKFVQAITAYAEEQRDRIHQETEDFKSQRLSKVEQEVLDDVYRLIQKENTSIRGEGIREISRRDLAARKELLARRRQIMDEVFSRAEEEILAFTQTPAYDTLLAGLLREAAAALPAEGTVYSISKRDEAKIPALSALCPPSSRIETSEDIRLGGVRGENAESGLIADNTLDSRLILQREEFVRTSGLTVG